MSGQIRLGGNDDDLTQAAIYRHGPRANFVERDSPFEGRGWIIEAHQPAGDHSSPATNELVLVQPVSPGISLKKRWGDAKFEGIAAIGSVWLVPPQTPVEIDLRVSHTIRMFGMGARAYHDGSQDLVVQAALEKLSLTPIVDATIDALLGRLQATSHDKAPDRLLVDELFCAIQARLGELAGERPMYFKGGLATDQVRKVTDHLSDRIATGISLAELAAGTGLSMFHFVRSFKTSLGVPPHRYLKLLRVHRAKDLLAKSDLSVLEIAGEVGYDSSQALGRAFRQEIGISPRSYRIMRRF